MVESRIWNNAGGRRKWNKNTMQHVAYKKFDLVLPLS